MLTSITLGNFKSYQKATLPLAAMTFLIGPNASGKSNALEAIRLLNWLAKGSRLDDIERAIQGGDTVVRGLARDLFREPNKPIMLGANISDVLYDWEYFSIEIAQHQEQLIIESEKITSELETVPLYQVDSKPKSHSDEIRVAYNNFKPGGNKPHIPCSNRQAIFYQLETPARFDNGNKDSQKIIPSVTKAFRENLRNIVFLDPRPTLMRDYVYIKDNEISEDGKNLSAVLFAICDQGSEAKQKLLAFVRSLPEQDITDIQFIKTERMDVMVKLEESFGEKTRMVDAPLLSDGTLRVLAIGAALLTAPQGALVVIEEIDNGVHPSRATTLVKQIESIASERKLRVLLTSHNPALLDALPDKALADVLCCYRDPKQGDSRLIRLGNLDRFPELVAQGPLGQLMTRRILERFLKDDTNSKQRQTAALNWLEKLKNEESETGK
jgi:predicted ATPase